MLGLRIKTLRKENGWNQTELGKKIGVGRTTITEYEADRIMPPYEKLQALANAFGVTVKYLTGEANSRTDVNETTDDVGEELSKMIDQLKSVDYSIIMDGVVMNVEVKDVLAGQLEQALRMVRYMNSLNKDDTKKTQ